ncbi:MAG: Vps62-related protein, partial [Solirubrobacteraceae bacterium]
VRVIAGFNVGVLAVALGLVGGRLLRTVIDQLHPGYWWALLAPWAVCSIVAAWLLGRVSPLKGGRAAHGALWLAVAAVAMLSSAPVGLLVLTWMGIGSLGRQFGSRSLPTSTVAFLRSPLPWVLLTIYALVAFSYSAMPPVSFSQTIVETTSGRRLGGYIGRTSAGVYLASCTPLADATSTDDRVQFLPAAAIRSSTSTDTDFTLDTGYRPSLPTLALRAFGIDTQTVAWIRPELKERRAPCAGTRPPRPSTGYEAPQLGPGVFAGPAPPGGVSRDGEAPIEQTTNKLPALVALAMRFQPTVITSITDPFWPVAVNALLHDIGAGGKGRRTCVRPNDRGKKCSSEAETTLADLQPQGSTPEELLEFPTTPALTWDPTQQLEAFLRGQHGRESPIPSPRELLADPGTLDPWQTAQIYFYYAGPATPARWPAPNQTIEKGLVALQYWFFYPYNYYPTLVAGAIMNQAPIAGDVANTDLHQGDWEHVTVLVEPRRQEARWLYTARHSNEGQYFRWNSPLLTFDEGHPVVQAAYGGHPSYPAGCGARRRYVAPLNGVVSDWLVCGPGRFAFRAATTPLVDLARTPWVCWKGHFGVVTPKTIRAASSESSIALAIERYVLVSGPRSPLWQAENGHLEAEDEEREPKRKPDSGPCVSKRGPEGPELEAESEGIGRMTPGKTGDRGLSRIKLSRR